MGYQLGIDLGTTYSAAAVCRPVGEQWVAPEMVSLSGRRTDVPSVLFVGPDGEVLVGDAAERRAVTDPDRVVREFKRRVGDSTPVVVGGRAWAPEELCARLVRWIVDQVADREGGPAERIAVTHPASWGGHKLELMAEALDEQGLAVTFLAEPQAAALHYAAGERVAAGSTIAVYDLGGGTFDAAVVRKTDRSHFTLQGRPEGIERLGGVDFDQVVFDHVVTGVPDAFEGLDDADPAVLAAVARLRRECTEAKEALSADTEASIPVLLPGHRGAVRLHRSEFEEAIRDRVEETVEALRRAVASAGLQPAGLDAVLLVGGSSRVPLVGQLVSQELGRPVAVDTDPKNAIAKGAALAVSPRPTASWPAVALAPVPDGPITSTGEGLVPPVPPADPSSDSGSGSMPALIGATVAIGPPAAGPPTGPIGSTGPIGATGGWATAGPPPRPGIPAPATGAADWDYDPEPAGRSRLPVGLLVGVGGALAATGVVLAAVFWTSPVPAVSSGVGGMSVSTSDLPSAGPTTTSLVPDPAAADPAPVRGGATGSGGGDAGRAPAAPAGGGSGGGGGTPAGGGAAPAPAPGAPAPGSSEPAPGSPPPAPVSSSPPPPGANDADGGGAGAGGAGDGGDGGGGGGGAVGGTGGGDANSGGGGAVDPVTDPSTPPASEEIPSSSGAPAPAPAPASSTSVAPSSAPTTV
ncbi:Hsp70 family protein [Pseudonocardia sp. RS010]|uniref:Hsp70 family protein n=1 Tax=Pseudonocardia sp. RS010 TaxID=3385979 RepID=UPI0039A3341B